MLETLNEELEHYDLDVEAAIALLEADGYTLDADGSPTTLKPAACAIAKMRMERWRR